MKRFESRTYSVSDFIEWRDRGVLDFSPHFQRRSVWSDKAKSYLIDTVVRELPIPKLIISQTFSASRQVRIVVDGQQRIRTFFDFYDNRFAVKKMHNPEIAGTYFEDMADEYKQSFLNYQLGTDVLFDASYEELIEIFARINTYTVKLNSQELRNALYLGYFKQAAFAIGKRYARYWLDAGVLRQGSISRMGEAELASNLLIVCLEGIESNKVVDSYYRKFDDDEGNLPNAIKLFDEVMTVLGSTYPDEELRGTIWAREPLFYSLFAAVRHGTRPVENLESNGVPRMVMGNPGRLRVALDSLSAEFESLEGEDQDDIDISIVRFIDVSRRRTADLGSRVERTKFISQYVNNRAQQ